MALDFTKIAINLLLKTPFLYRSLTDTTPIRTITHYPNPCWTGIPETGDDIINGTFHWAGYTKKNTISPWKVNDAPYTWVEYAHSFNWLYDTRLSQNPNSRKMVQQWTMAWLKNYSVATQLLWRSDIVARRLTSLLVHFDHYFIHTDKKMHNALMASITQHYKHLELTEGKDCDPVRRITALRGLIIGAISLNQTTHIKRHILAICQYLEDSLNRDGFNKNNHLPTQISYLKGCILVRSTLHNAQMEVPNILNELIKKIIPPIKFFFHQDGGISHMASWAGSRNEITQIIKRSTIKTENPVALENSGYYHIEADKTSIIFDASPRTNPLTDNAGVLGFELSHMKQRIFVNCGYPKASDHPIYSYSRTTSNHSCPAIKKHNAISIGTKKRICQTTYSLSEIQEWQLLQGSHNGYMHICGGIMKRHIAINPDGTEIRGQDSIIGNTQITNFESRFHLHPKIDAMCLPNNQEVILRHKKVGWRFRISNATLSLEDSYYMHENGQLRRAQQIVARIKTTEQNPTIKWLIQMQK